MQRRCEHAAAAPSKPRCALEYLALAWLCALPLASAPGEPVAVALPLSQLRLMMVAVPASTTAAPAASEATSQNLEGARACELGPML